MRHVEKLKDFRACSGAVKWAEQYKSAQAAWNACARLSLKHVSNGEDRPRIAIETAER
jgi:hypothetical protein